MQVNLVDDDVSMEKEYHTVLNNFFIQSPISIKSGKKTFVYHKNLTVDGTLNYVCSAINAEVSMIKANMKELYGLRLASGNFGKVFDFPATFGLVPGFGDRGLIMHDSDSRGKVHFQSCRA